MTSTTDTTASFKPGDRVAMTVRLTGDYDDWLAHPGDIAEVMKIASGDEVERGDCAAGQCDGPFYLIHFDHIAHANLECVCEHQVEAASTCAEFEPDLIEATQWYLRERGFADDAHELTPDIEQELARIFSAKPITAQHYARAAQFIACKRNTCGGPGTGHDHAS